MGKSGIPYEQLTAEIMRAFHPGADVKQNDWIEGPDGRRQCDVVIRGFIAGQPTCILIECKDWANSIPPEVIDALHSKANDLGASFAIICSNSPFSATVLKKAARVGIGAITLLKSGDDRARAEIFQECVGVDIKFAYIEVTLCDSAGLRTTIIRMGGGRPTLIRETYFDGRSILGGLNNALHDMAATHHDANHVTAIFGSDTKIRFEVEGEERCSIQLELDAYFVRHWIQQRIKLDSTQGIYDYVRSRVGVSPGETLTLSFDNDGWEPLEGEPDVLPGENVDPDVESLMVIRMGAVIPFVEDSNSVSISQMFPQHRYIIGAERPPEDISILME